MKKPCLISFDLFRPSIGDGIIHERLSVRLSLCTNNMQKICSDMCIMLKPTAPFPSMSPPSASPLPTTTPVTTDEPQEPINISFFLNDDFVCTRKFSIALGVYKLSNSDNENVRDVNANDQLKDGLKSTSIENVDVRRATGCSATC